MTSASSADPDLFFAVDGGGNCLPGPCLPQGLVKLSPDMVNHNTSGYASGELVRHFSHLHISGMGGAGRFGNIGIIPMSQKPDARTQAFSLVRDEAELGSYRCQLTQEQGFGELANQGLIDVELSATHRCGLHRYHWGEGCDPWIRIDLGFGISAHSIGGACRWLNSSTLVGHAVYRGGWGHEYPYSVFFCMQFSQPYTACFIEGQQQPPSETQQGQGAGLLLRAQWDQSELEIRVGISLVSIAEAERALEEETADLSFDQLREAAAACWKQRLSRFRSAGGSEEHRQCFSTMWHRLYCTGTRLDPQDVPWFAAKGTQFTDLVCLWDSVRAANSLLALVEPELQAKLCNALTEISEHMGWLPDAWLAGASGQIQGGTSAATLFAEAMKKELPGFDARAAFVQLQHQLNAPSPDPFLLGIYPQWRELGFCPDEVKNCASRSVEYAFADNRAAELAEHLGEGEQARNWRRDSDNIIESWSESATCFAPRKRNGDWVDFNPWKPQCRDFWNDPHYYEGTGHDYALLLWDRIPFLIEKHGGPEAFAAHLDEYMERCYLWKEINLHVPWLYHFAGMPHRSTQALRSLTDQEVKAGRRGLPDNEDMGAWSSWWIGHAMGLGVVPGSDLYLLSVPRFDVLELDLSLEHRLSIRCEGADVNQGFIVSASLNGAALNRAWLRHAELVEGGELIFQLAETPGDWGTQELPVY